MRCFLSLLLGIFTAVSCWAQVPRAAVNATVPPLIRVSGTLPNMQGTVGVNFALYAEQTGGAPLWMESQNVTPDEKGRFTIYLGANHAGGVPLDLFASGEARWLGSATGRTSGAGAGGIGERALCAAGGQGR